MSLQITTNIGIGKARLGTLLNFLWNWGFWSKETETDYYASLEDGEAYISLTQKEQ